jgi:hypothetical protein
VLELISIYMVNCGTLNLWVGNAIDTDSLLIVVPRLSLGCLLSVAWFWYIFCAIPFGRRLTSLNTAGRVSKVRDIYPTLFHRGPPRFLCAPGYVHPDFYFRDLLVTDIVVPA